MGKRRPMGSLEAQVLMQLWANPEGVKPSDVLTGLDADIAYTTVTTVLSRLWHKGLVSRVQYGRTFLYQPSRTEAELGAERMRIVLDGTSDREALLNRFVHALPEQDEHLLRELLADADE